jgi:hypothetical protein
MTLATAAEQWAIDAGQLIALLAAVFAYYKATRNNAAKIDDVHSAVVDVKRATGTNRRAEDEAAEPVKPEPSADLLDHHRRYNDPAPTEPTDDTGAGGI